MKDWTNTQTNARQVNLFKRSVLIVIAVLVAILVVVATVWLAISFLSTSPEAKEVVQRLEDRGLPIGEVKTYNAENDPNELLGRPGQYTSKVVFKDTRLDPDPIFDEFDVLNGGSVEVFENADDAVQRAEYLEGVTQAITPFNEYSYREGAILLRVSHRLTPEQAKEYESALQNVS